MIRLGYAILNRARIFKDYLLTWNNKRLQDQTWSNFQLHFRKAYRDLKKVNALQINQSTLNHTAMMDDLKTHQEQTIQQMTDNIKNSIYQTINHIAEGNNDSEGVTHT